MTAINAERGEVGLTLQGNVYPMLPTFAAANAIESQLGPVAALVARTIDNSKLLTLKDLSLIAAECIRAAGKDRNDPMLVGVSAEKLGQMIYEEGIVNVLQTFAELLANMVTGGAKKKDASPASA